MESTNKLVLTSIVTDYHNVIITDIFSIVIQRTAQEAGGCNLKLSSQIHSFLKNHPRSYLCNRHNVLSEKAASFVGAHHLPSNEGISESSVA